MKPFLLQLRQLRRYKQSCEVQQSVKLFCICSMTRGAPVWRASPSLACCPTETICTKCCSRECMSVPCTLRKTFKLLTYYKKTSMTNKLDGRYIFETAFIKEERMSRYSPHHMRLHTVNFFLSKLNTSFPQRYPERINSAKGRHILQYTCFIHFIAQC